MRVRSRGKCDELTRVAQRLETSAILGREAQVHIGTSIRAKGGVWVHLKAR